MEEGQKETIARKPNLYQLRERHRFFVAALAFHAQVNERSVYRMLVDDDVQTWQAEYILTAYNKMYNTSYTLDDISVALEKPREY